MSPSGGWTLVDVETSGTSSRRDRVLSLAAIALDANGRIEGEYASLFNPGCDPGPVHIHRLTAEKLRGAPAFTAALPQLSEMLAGRTLVAHNAVFDHGFLVEEAGRAGETLPITHRLCTVTLARRLQLDVPNVKLETLARHWSIPQYSAHDALDDVRTLHQVFQRSLDLADSLGLGLPVVACDATARAYPAKISRVPCPWRDPGRYEPMVGLVQGAKVVITGATSMPRADLALRLADAGLDVMNSVSGRTGLLIANAGVPVSRKIQRARELGIPIVDERAVLALAARILPGTPKSVPVVEIIEAPTPTPAPTLPAPTPAPAQARGDRRPWAGRRILVLGGPHVAATVMRSRLMQLGARPAVNLTATVTHVLALEGAQTDSRMRRVRDRGLPVLETHHVDVALGLESESVAREHTASEVAEPEPRWEPALLSPGAVIDIPSSASAFTVNVAWTAPIENRMSEVDVVAFELDEHERVLSDDEFVFYNQPVSPDGAVRLSIDGDCEQGMAIDLGAVSDEVERITVGAAIAERTFGDVGALSVSVDTTEFTLATAVLDAATTERSMIICEIYRRRGAWRIRALGQGYDDGLAEFAVRNGAEVDG